MANPSAVVRTGTGIEPLVPDWAVPDHIRAYSTTRSGGVSRTPFDSLNLGFASGDRTQAVNENRRRVENALRMPETPRWLKQVHGARVVDAVTAAGRPQADAAIAVEPDQVLAVMTADCIPVLMCDRSGTQVAVAHAGWRGLAAGVLENTVAAFDADAKRLMVWLGPGIGPRAFEVGPEVRQAFVAGDPGADSAFRPGSTDRLFADLYALARRRLRRVGVKSITGGGFCTYHDPRRFFSHRRDGPRSGRMASFIWLSSERRASGCLI